MPTATYIPLAEKTLAAAASTVTFSGISAAYRDLILVSNIKLATANSYTQFRLNNDTTSNYNSVQSLLTSSNQFNAAFAYFRVSGYTSTTDYQTSTTQFMDYATSDRHKSCLTRTEGPDAPDVIPEMALMRWANNTAINTINIFASVGSIAAGSSFILYGIDG